MNKILSHTKIQLLMALREPAYFFSTIIVPPLVFWFFGVPEAGNDYVGSFLCCSFSAFSFFGVFFFQYSISQSQEKDSDWAHFVRTLPSKSLTILFARFITSTLLAILSGLLIYIVARTLTPSTMSLGKFALMQAILLLASPPFLLLGLFLGNIFKQQAMVPIASFLHLTLSFVGGLWKPPEILPDALQNISPLLPTYHYGMLVWPLVIPEAEIGLKNVFYMVAFSIIMIALLFIQEWQKKGNLT